MNKVRSLAASALLAASIATSISPALAGRPPVIEGRRAPAVEKVNEYEGQHRKVNEYEGQHRKVNEYEGQHRKGNK